MCVCGVCVCERGVWGGWMGVWGVSRVCVWRVRVCGCVFCLFEFSVVELLKAK